MKRLAVAAFVITLVLSLPAQRNGRLPQSDEPEPYAPVTAITGFRDAAHELELERRFMAVPDPKLAKQHLKLLTAAPHIAGSPEDRKTAEYVARKFREAGLETEIRAYRVWMNTPAEISVDVVAPANVKMHGPTREHVEGDPYQDDARVVQPFNAYSPSGDAEADVVYANYGRPEDIKALADMGVDVRGKILLVRYGENFRGVKTLVAQEYGAAGVLIYSDPGDDGSNRGDVYPNGPWRPPTSVQRGSIQYSFEYAGDPTTPGMASTVDLPDSKRVEPERSGDMPRVPTTPLSAADATPLLQNLAGPQTPRDWQGGLPFAYHVGPGPVKVKLHLKQNYAFTIIWDVIGKVKGTTWPEQWVIAGNHRDAWVYGAVDPSSGTAAMLETVHGIGELLTQGWKPRRTLVFASWDAEEQGLIGSTEWVEQNEDALGSAVAYFNIDSGASGTNFRALASGSLKAFVREVARVVPSPQGGTVYRSWYGRDEEPPDPPLHKGRARYATRSEAPVGNLGSGSDFTPFIQHMGVPSTDIRSVGVYGVYHSVFDNYAWYTKFGDPTFEYTQELARMFGVEMLRMAQADVLPYDYEQYGREIAHYIERAESKAEYALGRNAPDFTDALAAAQRLSAAGARVAALQRNAPADANGVNLALLEAERALLLPEGLPGRSWYRHAVYAPGRYSGYTADVLPGIAAAMEKEQSGVASEQVEALAAALNRAAEILENAIEP